jgi:predicted phage tail protein
MKKFVLHGEMAKQFCESIELNVKTMRDAIDGIACNYPSFKSYYVNKSTKGVSYVFVSKTGDKLENFCMDMPLTENEYSILPAIEGAAGAAGMAGGFLGNFALGYAMQWLSDQTKPQDDGTPEYEIITTNSSIYSQNENRAEQGLPVPVVYGQIRIGSQIIHSSIHNYDMDFNNNLLYAGKPKRTRLSKLIGGADYSFIDSTEVTDYRAGTTESFNTYLGNELDPSKRSFFDSVSDQTKALTRGHENEAFNGGFSNSSDSSNELKQFGPSEDTPEYSRADADWWDHTQSTNPRPFVYPKSDHIDVNMRPSGPDDITVERASKAGSVPTDDDDRILSWRNANKELTVGSRGQYQKLESLGMYKSLEILSEGPIAGLANPITGLDRDNGYINYPYGKTDPTLPEGAAHFGFLKYDFDSDSLLSENDDLSVTIEKSGQNYTDGTYILTGNGKPVGDFFIRADKPVSLKAAKINDIRFREENVVYYINNVETATEPKYYSSNGLFLLNSGDGSIHPNTNNNIADITGALSNAYLSSETTANAGTTGVFNLNALQTDSEILNKSFKIGSSYGNTEINYSISPHSEPLQYKCEIEKTTKRSRVSQAEVVDLGSRYKDLISDPDFQTVYDNEYKDRNAATLPLTSFTWREMARIYVDGDYGIENNLNQTVTITIASRARVWGTCAANTATITITLAQYLSLADVTVVRGNGCPMDATNLTVVNGRAFTSYKSDQTTNWFTELADGTTNTVPLGVLLRDPNFANQVFGGLNIAPVNMTAVTLPSFDYGGLAHGGGLYPKFGVGSGSNTAPSNKVGNFSRALPTYIIEANKDNFDSVTVREDGAIDEDGSFMPKGFYSPFLYPRVTVFVLRKSLGRFSWLPTSIDCVAQVSASGTILAIHLLRVPDLPVYDTSAGGFTPIMPQEIEGELPFLTSGFTSSYQDLGLYCKVDPSNESVPINLDINNGSLAVNNVRRSSFQAEVNWGDNISLNNPSIQAGFGAGIFRESRLLTDYNDSNQNITKNIILDSPPSHVNDPTTNAVLRVTVESIDISDAAEFKVNSITSALTNGGAFDYICTGRPIAATLINTGAGYTGKNDNNINGTQLTFQVFHETFTVSKIDISSNGNRGYKPNDEFYVYGISSTKNSFPNGTLAPIYFSFKAKAIINKYGEIKEFDIIDGGYGFSSIFDADDLVFSHQANNNHAGAAAFLGYIPNPDDTFNLDPDRHFPKQDLILTVDSGHLNLNGNAGSVSKFYVRQIGKGFVRNQVIEDPFEANSFAPPVFQVVVQGGSVSNVTITDPTAKGYSADDTNILLQFCAPQNPAFFGADDPSQDANAWARSIFLNDVPIRDRNDRFNFSKFHFDMRIGHAKNGNGDSNLLDNSILSPSTQPNMISDEFKLPSFTKEVDYPLYGPRNEGEKDYYYTHTIKNPEVSVVGLSIKIEELHYIYEGDESALYVNLIPLLAGALGAMLGKALADGIAAALVQDPVAVGGLAGGSWSSVGIVSPQTATVAGCMVQGGTTSQDMGGATGMTVAKTGELAKEAIMVALLAGLAGLVVGTAVTYIANTLIKCSDVSWLCFKVGELIKNSGEIWPAKMRLNIEYGVEGEDLLTDVIEFKGCATSPYVKDILIENFPDAKGVGNNFKNRIIKVYRTTRETDPVTGGIVEARYKIKASLASVTEYVEGFFGYPNTAIIGTRLNSRDHKQIPKREYLVKGRLINVPSNYNPELGSYSGDWDGTFNENIEWTSNPAWIILDLLTNERYGMGKYGITLDEIDIWSFYTFSKFCDEKVEAIIDGVLTSERRHMCNIYIDAEKQAYDYIKELLHIYNSSINFNNGKIYITTDSSISTTNGSIMLFTNSNVSEEGFSYSSTPQTQRVTAVTVDYLDERDNYMQKSEYVEDSEGMKEHGYIHSKIAGIGITRRGEAHRLAWHKMLSFQLEKEIIEFKTGLQASYLRIDDVVEILDNNKVSKHSGGRIVRIVNSTTIEIDIPTAALDGTTASLLLQKPMASDNDSDTASSADIIDRRASQYQEYTINSKNGFLVEFTAAIDSSIIKGSTWIINENTTDKIKPKKYRIKNIKEIAQTQYQIVAIEYLEDKYEQIDSSTSARGGIYIEEREYYGHNITV